MKRRDFLKTAGSFVASAGLPGLLGCGDDGRSPDGGPGDGGPSGDAGQPGRYLFPHGVASGDPRPSSVMVWTRVTAEDGSSDPVELTLEVATDDSFSERVLSLDIEASSASDHTVRVLVQELSPDTIYYYRFSAGADRSRVGRTWTAPEAGADVPVRFAWVSCQDYSAGFYGAYRRMINDDEAAPAAERLRFVLHVGDFIYETRLQGFQMALDADLEPVDLVDRDGNPRAVAEFPSGGGELQPLGSYARTVDDYRHLYKTFLADPDLQAARARWPFVCVWDDHEFSDDAWQTQVNYSREDSTDEPSQARKVAANQAWFEYIPAILSDAEAADGVAPAARDFEPVSVEDAPYDDVVEVDEPNNQSAISSLTIYRRLRFGKHVDLVLTDSRSYRSDHAIAEQSTAENPVIFHPRAAVPLAAVNAFDAGSTADGGPPDSVAGIANTRQDSPPGTLLGAEQKRWWKDVMAASTSTFKVWGNPVPLLRIRLDSTAAPLFPGDLVLSADAWDGYPSERRELMTYLRDEGIRNVVSLSGDHHAHLAGLVHDDHDAEMQAPVMVDVATAGISSTSQWTAVAGAVQATVGPNPTGALLDVRQLIYYDATELGGTSKAVVNLNTVIRYGSPAAALAAQTNDLAMVEEARDPNANPHLRYVDTAANGYGIAEFGADEARIALITIEQPIEDRGEQGSEVRGRAEFVVPRVSEGEPLTLDEPVLTGQRPFPLE